MKKALLIASVVLIAVAFIGCQPKEVTSAKVYLQQKNYEAALDQLKQASETYTDNSFVFNLLGQVYGELDSFPQMAEAFQKSLAIDSAYYDDIRKWREGKSSEAFNKGLRNAKKEKWDEAIKWYEISTIVDPSSANAWKNLGYVYKTTEQLDKSKEAYLKAFEVDPKDEIIALEIARSFIDSENNEDSKEAIKVLNQCLENIKFEKKEGTTFIFKEDGKKTREVTVETLTEKEKQTLSNVSDIWLLKGEAFSKLEQNDSAIVCMEKAYELNPEESSISFNIGATAYNMKDYATAAKYFGIYTEQEPDDESGYSNLAYSLSGAEKYDEGVKIGETMTQKFPGSAEAWEQYAVFIAKANTTEEDKRKGIVALSIAAGIREVNAGNAKNALTELKDAIKDSGMKAKLADIINAAEGEQAVKDEVISKIK